MDIKKTPLAVAIFAEAVWIICLLFVLIFPNFSKTVFQSWTHGIDLTTIWNTAPISLGSIILGVISVFVITYVLVWFFIVIYLKIAK